MEAEMKPVLRRLLSRGRANCARQTCVAAVAVLFFVCRDARGTTISITGPANYSASIAECVSFKTGQDYTNCRDDSHLDDVALKGDDATFKKSFDAWNATNAADAAWTLADGGALPGGDFDVSTFKTFTKATFGAVEIQIDWTYAGADKGDFKWVQGLYDNFLLDNSIGPAVYEMDVRAAAGCDNADLMRQCPPFYPFQYDDRFFYDKAQARWPNAFFEARAFLSKVDFTTRKLTIYEGVDYRMPTNSG
jgi:hypothetical protein